MHTADKVELNDIALGGRDRIWRKRQTALADIDHKSGGRCDGDEAEERSEDHFGKE